MITIASRTCNVRNEFARSQRSAVGASRARCRVPSERVGGRRLCLATPSTVSGSSVRFCSYLSGELNLVFQSTAHSLYCMIVHSCGRLQLRKRLYFTRSLSLETKCVVPCTRRGRDWTRQCRASSRVLRQKPCWMTRSFLCHCRRFCRQTASTGARWTALSLT